MCDPPVYPKTKDGITLELRHCHPSPRSASGEKPKTVLLLHGASANHETFVTPGGGLAAWLTENDFDVWLLDWRGSSLVVEKHQEVLGDRFTLNKAAELDVPAAIQKIRKVGEVTGPIAAVGHCMGSTVLAEAIARGHVPTGKSGDLDCVVFLTLALFYEAPVDSRLKSEERILEQLKSAPGGTFRSLDPSVEEPGGELKAPWPEKLEKLYKVWPAQSFHGTDSQIAQTKNPDRRKVQHLCNRLSFMYGMPYDHDNLVDQIHGTESIHPVLQRQFGAIPVDMFIHAARNLRQGHSTQYELGKWSKPDENFLSDEAFRRFRSLKHITLITGALNRLWHRNSVDLMYEWLTRGTSEASCRIKKRILPTYAHQDLLWGKRAAQDVFPKIVEGLRA